VKKEVVEIEEDDEDDEPVVKRARRSEQLKEAKKMIEKLRTEPAPEPKKTKKNNPDTVSTSSKEAEQGPNASQSAEEAEEDLSEEEEDDEDEKPEIAAKAREKIQTTLKSKAKDPYPDWKPGEPVPYAALCTTFSLIEMTSKRLIITSHCSLFLRQVLRLTPGDLLPTVMLMINKLAADYAGIELGIGESLIMKAIGESTGRSLQVIKADQKEIGDLGLVAVKSRANQPTMFKPKPLTIKGVLDGLIKVATTSGNGAQGRKVDLIKKLLSAADGHSVKVDITKDKGGASEAKFIVRFLEGKLRLGLAERTVLVSLAQAMVCHEIETKGSGKVPSTEQLAKGESILKQVYR
jgi:DNA ligase-1